jgi:hypothetical protein
LGAMLIPFVPVCNESRVPGVEVPIPMRPKGDSTVEMVKTGVLAVEVAILHALATRSGIVVVLEME